VNGSDFEVIDQHNARHRFSGALYWWAWRPTGENKDVDDFKILDVFKRSDSPEFEDEVVLEFPYPAVVGYVGEGIGHVLPLRERPLSQCPRCGFKAVDKHP